MRFLELTPVDIKNGAGLRTVLWVSGCNHHCIGCHNPATWDCEAGELFDHTAKRAMFSALSISEIQGITFSGGDPMHPKNVNELGNLVREIREKMPEKDIWVYTGYTLTEKQDFSVLKDQNANEIYVSWLKDIDVLVDGPYIHRQRQADLINGYDPKWVGSSNQRVIDIRRTLTENKFVSFVTE